MSAFGRMHKATAVVPLAVLSAAWTASLVGVGAQSASAEGEGDGVLPDGTTIPSVAVEAPASVGEPVTRVTSVEEVSASGIPEAALAAYQRAEAVINKADTACNVPWELIAAIGRVESDHGRYGGSSLSDSGLARPGIYGIALDGSNNTQRIVDTDGGAYDKDTKFDRAVGPMQFIPSTWSVVGVDGDNDGTRNPQDIDDAALATAVYLCSGDDDLSTEQGQRASVYRYNHSNAYVDLVLEIMRAYLDGDFSSVPNGVTSTLLPDPTSVGGAGGGGGGKDGGRDGGKGGQSGGGGGGGGKDGGRDGGKGDGGTGGGTSGSTGGSGSSGQPSPTTSTQSPTASPSQTQDPTQSQDPTASPTADPTKSVTELPTPTPTVVPTTAVPQPTLPPPTVPTITPTLTFAEAVALCTGQGVVDNPVTATNELTDCANKLLNP